MSGPEHYREAGRLAAEARFASDEPENTSWTFDAALRAAHVHATLALAAAAALGSQDQGMDPADAGMWTMAASAVSPIRQAAP